MIGNEARIALNDALTPIWNAAGLGDEKHDEALNMLVHRVADYIEVRQRHARKRGLIEPAPALDSPTLDAICAVIDRVKTDERQLDTNEYAGMIEDIVRGVS